MNTKLFRRADAPLWGSNRGDSEDSVRDPKLLAASLVPQKPGRGYPSSGFRTCRYVTEVA